MRNATLCFLIKGDEVCLGLKKRGFGVNRWNGFGGKVSIGESPLDCVKREVKEELGVDLSDVNKVAEIIFLFPLVDKEKNWGQLVHVYASKEWAGEPSESEEMSPKWFPKGRLPYDLMWDGDKIWLPLVLKGNKFKAEFSFDINERVTNKKMEIVEDFNE